MPNPLILNILSSETKECIGAKRMMSWPYDQQIIPEIIKKLAHGARTRCAKRLMIERSTPSCFRAAPWSSNLCRKEWRTIVPSWCVVAQ